ncbi:hypothetical protein KGY72_05390 [Candidatus Bipolaricaulota bacterium]|nr:hypothetical protein [Candidatus Bipolaricaulota bacterium]
MILSSQTPTEKIFSTMDELKETATIYGKNFFRLTLPFLVFFGFSLTGGIYAFPQGSTVKVTYGFLLGLLALFCSSSVAVDSWGSLHNVEFGLIENWKYTLGKLPVLLLSTLIAIVPWLVLLYLFLNFYSFFLFVPLAVYPFFFLYLLPSVLVGNAGPVAAIRDSFKTSWSNSTRTATLTYLPGFSATALVVIEIYSPVILILVPAWIVLITVNYCHLNQPQLSREIFCGEEG